MRVVTFGELMLKLSPPDYQRIIQANSMSVEYSGAEANVAVSLANYGVDVLFVSKLPANSVGDSALNALRRYGVDVSCVVRGGDRIGIYFAEKGASQRPSMVIYDRKGSAMACSDEQDFDWDAIFDRADWFHITGITPALSHKLSEICVTACRVAKDKGITVSCDLNYRKKLWNKEQANTVMSEMCKYVDVCISNEEDAYDVFGIVAEGSDANAGFLDEQSYVSVAKQLQQRFGFRQVAITLRESLSASDNNWSAILLDGDKFYSSPKYAIHLVDRIGGGDSFSAGLVFGLLHYNNPQLALDFAVAASCLKQSIEGDFNHMSIVEVERLMYGAKSGRVDR